MIAHSASISPEEITPSTLAEFKIAVSSVLSPYASAILVDPEYGFPAAYRRAKSCGLLLAYEMDGYENPRPHRMLALMPRWSVRRLRDRGAHGIKILLHYAPKDHPSTNDEKCALIERIGTECDALDMPFFLEPVVYDPNGLDQRSFEFARMKPELVIQTMEEFSKDRYSVDILKVEFPVTTCFVEDTPVYCGRPAYSTDEALAWFRAADAVARRPYIYLSAGVSNAEFLESLRLAAHAGARFSGVLCGRANWQGGVPTYARPGPQFDTKALNAWLRASGVNNIKAVNAMIESATPWHDRFKDPDV